MLRLNSYLYIAVVLCLGCLKCFAGAGIFSIVADFEEQSEIGLIRIHRDVTKIYQNTDLQFIKEGNGSLGIVITEGHNPNADGRAVFDLPLKNSIDMSGYKSLSFWLFVPKELVAFSYGRNDVSIFPNSTDPRYIKAAVNAGWNLIHWDFKDIDTFPVMHSLRLVFGPFLAGYDSGTLYVDKIVLEQMPQLTESDVDIAIEIISKDEDWTKRYQAVKVLRKKPSIESIMGLLIAIADGKGDFGISPEVFTTGQAVAEMETYGSQAVRSAAKEAIVSMVGELGDKLMPIFKQSLSSSDMRIRLAIVDIIGKTEGVFDHKWVIETLESMLLDNVYYVRDASIRYLETNGYDKGQVTEYLVGFLKSSDQRKVSAAIRTLSEIGSKSEAAIPELLKIIRDNNYSTELRCWAIRAVWNTSEDYLESQDWVQVLSIKPGDIHRHLLNIATDRLEKAGQAAVPALVVAAENSCPEVRARAASIIGAIGSKADVALQTLNDGLNDEQWYVRWQSAKSLMSIEPDNVSANEVLNKVNWFKDRELRKDVQVLYNDNGVTFDNGILQMVFNHDSYNPGPEIVRRGDWGPNLFSAKWIEQMMAFKDSNADNMLERSWFQKIFGAPVNKDFKGRLVSSDCNYAHYSFIFPANESVFIEWEQHYVLRRGESGFYMYITARNVSGKGYEDSVDPRSANSIGEFRLLLTPTWDIYDTIIMHDKLKGPSKYTFTPQGFMPYPDIYQCTYRVPSGSIDAKHEWDNYELESNVIGLCNNEQGIWFIMPDFESVDGSLPLLHVNSVNRNMFVIHCEGKYYVDSATKITADFEKIYGPYFFYINSGESREELWVDAKRKAQQEICRFPYEWVKNDKYHNRGSVRGSVSIADGETPEGAWVILSMPREDAPEDYYGKWLLNTNPYKYWTKVSEDGLFEFNNVIADDYSIFVWKDGVFGEFQQDGIVVESGKATDTGNLNLVPISKGEKIWQIGIPNRTVTEFKNGNNFHQWDNYIRYHQHFPEGVNFTIGKSDYSRDWNYIQPAAVKGEWKPTTWTVNFNMEELSDKDGLLTVVCIGRYAEMDVIINGTKIGDITIMARRIGAHLRSAPYDELYHKEFMIDKNLLKKGKNSIQLTFAKVLDGDKSASELHFEKWTSYMAYDFIRFELLSNQ